MTTENPPRHPGGVGYCEWRDMEPGAYYKEPSHTYYFCDDHAPGAPRPLESLMAHAKLSGRRTREGDMAYEFRSNEQAAAIASRIAHDYYAVVLDTLEVLLIKAESHFGAPMVNDVPSEVRFLLDKRRRERRVPPTTVLGES